MATRDIDSDAAFELLRITSNNLNLNLRAVADHVLRTQRICPVFQVTVEPAP